MKILTSVARILVGCLFIFSGAIKSNDPKGMGIKLNEYFDVFASDFQKTQDSVLISFSDNHGRKDSSWMYLNVNDSVKFIEVNRSSLSNVIIEAEDSSSSADSVMATEIFVVLDGNTLFKHKYTLKNENDKHNIKIRAVSGSDSILCDKTYNVTSANKLEEVITLNVYPIVKPDSFMVGFFKALKPYSVLFSIILCVLEIVLGFALLIGWKPKLTTWLLLITIVFFTFLTGYSAIYNKVTSCGCFGDAIPLTPWQSFYKDILFFTPLILFLFFRRKHIVPLFSPLFGWNAMSIITLASTSFAVYTNSYLPIKDYLPYKVGNNIKQLMTPPAGQRDRDSVQMVFIYEKGGVKKSFMLNALPKAEDGWKYVDRKDSIIIKAWKSEIQDFGFGKRDDKDVDIKDSILNSSAYIILIVSGDLEKANDDAWEDIKQIATDAKAKGIQVYAATSSMLEEADVFTAEHQLPFKFNTADQTFLKTIMRSNPGVIFWKDATVLGKWSSRNVPKIQKLEKLMK